MGGLAGCLGGDGDGDGGDGSDGGSDSGSDGGSDDGSDDGSDNEYEEWPPSGDRIDFTTASSPGDGSFTYVTTYAEFMPEYLPMGDQLSVEVESIPGLNLMRHPNRMYSDAPTDGGELGLNTLGAMANNQVQNPDEAEYDLRDFRYPFSTRSYTRGIILNHRTTPIDDLWEMTWDDYVEWAPDLNHATWGVSHGSAMACRLLWHFSDELSVEEMEDQFVHFGSGSDLRAAFEREEVDVVLSSFAGQYPEERQHYYKLQLMFVDSRMQGWLDNVKEVEPDVQTLHEDTNLETENVQTIVDLVADRFITMLPPGTSDEVYDIYVDMAREMAEDEDLYDAIDNNLGDARFNHAPNFEVDEAAISALEAREENMDLLDQLTP